MTDVSQQTETESNVRVRPNEPPRGRLIRMLHWIRGASDKERARDHYANVGVWSSRVYAVTLPIAVLLSSLMDIPSGIDYLITSIWAVATYPYMWYQGKAALAYDVVEETHANRDLINSVLPAISIGVLIAIWLLMIALYYAAISTKTVSYGYVGWYMILIAVLQVGYDVTVNNLFTFRLGKIPGRVEMRENH